MTWVEACLDRSLQNLPYKVELNRQGKVVMSPTRNKHGYYQAEIAYLLRMLLPHGQVLTECGVDTPEGTFVADATWASRERFAVIENEFSFSIAPEICVEIWSPSNTAEEIQEKRKLYHLKGAVEFWYCDEHGRITFYDQAGRLTRSTLCPDFPELIGR